MIQEVLNQKTVYQGTSMKEFGFIRDLLDHNKIPYKYKTTDLQHNSYMGHLGVTRSLGGNWNSKETLLYEIIVNMDDYENAMYLIAKEKK